MQLLNFSGQKKWQRDSCISKGVPIPKVSSPISLQGHLNDKIRVYCLDIGDCPFINTKDMFLRACCVAVVISVCLSAPAPREIRRGLFSEMFGEGLQMFGGIAHTFVNGVEHAVGKYPFLVSLMPFCVALLLVFWPRRSVTAFAHGSDWETKALFVYTV